MEHLIQLVLYVVLFVGLPVLFLWVLPYRLWMMWQNKKEGKTLNILKKKEDEAYEEAFKSARETGKKLDEALKKAGVDPKQFEV